MARVIALLGATGLGLLAIAVGEGNQLIFAGPLAVWLGAILWPSAPESRSLAVPLGVVVAVWVCGIGAMVPKIGRMNLEREVEESMKLVEAQIGEQRWHDALALLDTMYVPRQFPLRNAQRHHNRGFVLLQLRRSIEASREFELALSYDATDVEACVLLGRIAFRDSRYSDALSWFRRALRIEPGRADVQAMRALTEELCES